MPPSFMNAPAHYLHWHISLWGIDIYITLANLIVIVLMIAVFVLAFTLPFPHREVEQ